MPNRIHFTIAKIVVLIVLTGIQMLAGRTSLLASNPEYFNPVPAKPFVLTLGIGYGISNDPVLQKESSVMPGGITLSGSLGYKLNKRFSLDFGPAVWIESHEIFQAGVASGERSSNKRMLISFNGYYLLSNEIPLTIKLGGGIGTLVYSPHKNTVVVDSRQNEQTEFLNGPAFTASVIYKLKLNDKLSMHPSVNFWYIDLKPADIEYLSNIDTGKPSTTTDFRLQFFFSF